jgi:hypothetical protein
MKKWSVQYRTKKGSVEVLIIEAEDRNDVFRILSERGIIAISVSEGISKSKKCLYDFSKPKFRTVCFFVSLVVLASLSFYAYLWFSDKDKNNKIKTSPRSDLAKSKAVAVVVDGKKQVKKTPSVIAKEYNEKVKEFIKKTPGTNKVSWIVPPIDPNDPDNALRTRVAQELGSLLSVEPGEPMPPFPYSFLLEDDLKKAKEQGEDVGEIENGNKNFLESLRKWKITAKSTDSEQRLDHKSKLIEAQTELLAGMNEGISVNDSIRAAYEFRKRAYEIRSSIINTLSELVADNSNQGEMISQIKEINTQLAEEGIKQIAISEVIPDYEGEEEQK